MFGLVRPVCGRPEDRRLRRRLVSVLMSAGFQAAVVRYNRCTRQRYCRVVMRASAPASVRPVLEKQTAVYRVCSNVYAAMFPPRHPQIPDPDMYHIQVSERCFPTAAERVMRHELLHLAAAANGQKDGLRHELLVQWVTTPEVLFGYGLAIIVLVPAALLFVL